MPIKKNADFKCFTSEQTHALVLFFQKLSEDPSTCVHICARVLHNLVKSTIMQSLRNSSVILHYGCSFFVCP